MVGFIRTIEEFTRGNEIINKRIGWIKESNIVKGSFEEKDWRFWNKVPKIRVWLRSEVVEF